MNSSIKRWSSGVGFALAILAAALFSESIAAREGSSAKEEPLTNQSQSGYDARDDQELTKEQRLREGTIIKDQSGHFRQDGDGAIFVTEEGLELGSLPNLNLERIMRTLKNTDESRDIWWNVSGVVTEFSGRNYLLIGRAVYKSAAPPPAPEQLDN